MAVPIVSSRAVKPRHLKMLFWGDTGTRKTESILRYFPDVLLIDTEGNAEQCVDMPEIPEFLLAKTKSLDEVIEVVDAVAAGKYKFPDGRPVQTLALDSLTVLWTIRKDTRSLVAEERTTRYGRSAEEANFTQLDWTMAKRPLTRLNTRLANCPIKYVIYTARQSDAYKNDDKRKDVLVKIGEKPDAIKGLEYEMNLVLQMLNEPDGKWACVVTKVQGGLGAKLPKGKKLPNFPHKVILEYTGHLTGEAGNDQDEIALAEQQAAKEAPPPPVPARPAPMPDEAAKAAFLEKARELGYATGDGQADMTRIRQVLAARGITGFKPSEAEQYLIHLRQALVQDGAASTFEAGEVPHPDAGKEAAGANGARQVPAR